MISKPSEWSAVNPASAAACTLLHDLIPLTARLANAQLDAFSARLSNALLAVSDAAKDQRQAKLAAGAGSLLKNHQYAFYHLASRLIEERLRAEVSRLAQAPATPSAAPGNAVELTLVSYAEMEQKVSLGNVSRAFEAANEDGLAALNARLASLLGREGGTALNPFRPEVFLGAIASAWADFDPEPASAAVVLPLLRPDVFIELEPVYRALNDALQAKGVAPRQGGTQRIQKTTGAPTGASKPINGAALSQQLKRLFSESPMEDAGGSGQTPGSGRANGMAGGQGVPGASSGTPLFGYLADLQKRGGGQHIGTAGSAFPVPGLMQLAQLKQQVPRGAMSRVDETTIDLLTQVFDTVFKDKNIPQEIKELIGFLQIPVLKAALVDKEFFFQEAHPARRLIEVLSKSGVGWDKSKGSTDPLYQTIKRSVDRVHQEQEFDQEGKSFSEAVSDLETFIADDDAAASAVLSAPITQALKREKLRVATQSAESEVAVRIATGEVATFVEAFLEKRWVPILTLAYSVRDEKPQLLESAVNTMDQLIWSVKPKATAEARKELVGKLPALLAALNKWITLMKWDDAERLQFFAELAECHASIVRAPLDLSPQRQIEVAVEATRRAAEKRAALRANAKPEPLIDEFAETVDTLQRGVWLGFKQKNGSEKKVKLAWVSPLRTLYIFTTTHKEEAFSVSAEELAQTFRDGRVQILVVDRFVDRALTQALDNIGANDEMLLLPASA